MPLSKCSRSPKIKLLNINSVPILLDKRDATLCPDEVTQKDNG